MRILYLYKCFDGPFVRTLVTLQVAWVYRPHLTAIILNYLEALPYKNHPIRTKIEVVALNVFEITTAELFNSMPYNNQISPPIVKQE